MKTIRDYFEAEMLLLHEEAQRFAEAYPEQAGLLNLQAHQDRDPFVERLLEGVAYLTGQIRQRIDDDLPDISANFLAQLWPQLLQPFPSVTIIEFSYRHKQLLKSYPFPKGTLIHSAPVGEEHTICHFRTTSTLIINPIYLDDVKLIEVPSGKSMLKLFFKLDKDVSIEALNLAQLKLYLHADPTIALFLYHVLTAKLLEIKVSSPSEGYLDGANISISGSHFSIEDALLPICHRNFYGFHLLHEYFAFREKHLFIQFDSLDKLSWPNQCSEFILEIYFESLCPSDAEINKKNFRLHCVPAVNLYDQTSEPIAFTRYHFEYPLYANINKKESIILQSINAVNSINRLTGVREKVFLLQSFNGIQDNEKAYYQLITKDNGKEYPQHYLQLTYQNPSCNFSICDISCEITINNGFYPHRYLMEGMINHLLAAPHFIMASNITRPSNLLFRLKRADYLWQLISCLSLNINTLTNLSSLKNVLHIFNWTNSSSVNQKINGIQRINSTPINQIWQGIMYRGLEILLIMDESGFRSIDDIYLFGCVLHQFFSMYTSINSFVRTIILCHPSQRELIWHPAQGKKISI